MGECFGLYLVLTEPRAGYERCTEAAVEHGIRYVQLRMKNRPPPEVLAMARRMRAICVGSHTRLIVNDDVLVAAEADVDGVHLGQSDMPIEQARRLWPVPGKVFGLSTHNEEQAMQATRTAPNYIGVGPVWPTPAKQAPDPVLGVARVGAIVRASPLTAVAIGAIDESRLLALLAAGVANFAVVRAVCQAPDPFDAVARLQAIWQEHQQS
ncbi:MAG: thiamine phosphate synthase [Polyangiaceae bacterium]|jgi:thiamine-phosphate pyrophosphorylase|nr:thiamine phosphate synthase [Polyangiaceae bacterium]